MSDTVIIDKNDVENTGEEYFYEISEHFSNIPDIAQPLIKTAKATLSKIEQMLYSAPAFINAVRSSIPDVTFQAVLTGKQKAQLADGALQLMTRKDGSLLANLVNPKTNKIVSTISLERVKLNPEITQAMTSYTTQMQMAQIAEQIQLVQVTVEEVRQGQENDRLATAYSCQQKLLQAMKIQNPELRSKALLMLAFNAEDSRNLLMQSQTSNLAFIKSQPDTFWGKLLSGAKQDKIDGRMEEIRDSICAVNMGSLVAAMAYEEMGEQAAARQSLQYYADYIRKSYLDTPNFIERLDSLYNSTENYWSKAIPEIERKIMALPCIEESTLSEGEER